MLLFKDTSVIKMERRKWQNSHRPSFNLIFGDIYLKCVLLFIVFFLLVIYNIIFNFWILKWHWHNLLTKQIWYNIHYYNTIIFYFIRWHIKTYNIIILKPVKNRGNVFHAICFIQLITSNIYIINIFFICGLLTT